MSILRAAVRVTAGALRSKSTFASAPIQISVSDDGATIVCWHPEQALRYEDTKPLPVAASPFVDSVLRPEVHEEVSMIMKKKDLTEEDLMRLAYVPRYRWRRIPRVERRHVLHPNPPIDRIGV